MDMKFLRGIIFFLLISIYTISQAMVVTTSTSVSTTGTPVNGTLVIPSSVQVKIDALLLKLQTKRTNYVSSEAWNLYLGKIEGQIDVLRLKYSSNAGNIVILDVLSQGIESLKETSIIGDIGDIISGDALPSLPFCGQPPMSTCQLGMFCIQMMPQPKTYTSYDIWKKDNAQYLYDGVCNPITVISLNGGEI